MKKTRVREDSPLSERVLKQRIQNEGGLRGEITDVSVFEKPEKIFEDNRWDDLVFLRTSYLSTVIIEVTSASSAFYIGFYIDPMVGETEFIDFLFSKTEFPSERLDTILYGEKVKYDREKDIVYIDGNNISCDFCKHNEEVPEPNGNIDKCERWILFIRNSELYSCFETTIDQVYERNNSLILTINIVGEDYDFYIPEDSDFFWKIVEDLGYGILNNIQGSLVHVSLRDWYDYKGQDLKSAVATDEDNIWVLSTNQILGERNSEKRILSEPTSFLKKFFE